MTFYAIEQCKPKRDKDGNPVSYKQRRLVRQLACQDRWNTSATWRRAVVFLDRAYAQTACDHRCSGPHTYVIRELTSEE